MYWQCVHQPLKVALAKLPRLLGTDLIVDIEAHAAPMHDTAILVFHRLGVN
ncbi:hypothetical protein [Sinorhizobium terangae]|uniref:hypothetical protein n=1 Tax=Sinorhizobium terangae TaxID=110322 RepID=UPI0024B04CE4|nr:hypothetical protein [Sinorhizobium terangae]WFU51647.1 hypothetical protein QA637_21625 [Sinorhizobium terangae]